MTSREQEKEFQEGFEAQQPQQQLNPATAVLQPRVGRFRKKAVRKGLNRTIDVLNAFIFTLFDLATILMPGLLVIGQGMNAGKTILMIVQESLGIPTKKVPRPEILKTATLLTGSFLAVGLQAVAVASYFVPALVFLAPAFFLASIMIGSALVTYDLVKKFHRRNDVDKDYPMGKLKFQSALARASFAYTALAVTAVLFFLPGVQIAAIAAISILAAASALMLGFRVWKTLKRHRDRSKVTSVSEDVTDEATETPAPVLASEDIKLNTVTPDEIGDTNSLPTLSSRSSSSELSIPTQAPSIASTGSDETSLTRSQSSSSLEAQTIGDESKGKLRKSSSVPSFFASSDQNHTSTAKETNTESKHP